MRRKRKFLDDTLEKEKKDLDKCTKLREKEKSRMTAEADKKKIRQEMKKMLEQKWQTVTWVVQHLDIIEK